MRINKITPKSKKYDWSYSSYFYFFLTNPPRNTRNTFYSFTPQNQNFSIEDVGLKYLLFLLFYAPNPPKNGKILPKNGKV